MNAGIWLRARIARFDALERRERLLLVATVLVLGILLWDVTLRSPLAQRHAAALERMERVRGDIAALEDSRAALVEELRTLAQDSRAGAIERLRAQLSALDTGLSERTARLVSPQQMVEVLRDVVNADAEVRLVRLKNAGAEPVITETQPGADAAEGDIPRVYRHHVELVIEGRYLAMLDYLRRLEGLQWRFQWDHLTLETVDYPTARATISLSTLGLAEDWIGV